MFSNTYSLDLATSCNALDDADFDDRIDFYAEEFIHLPTGDYPFLSGIAMDIAADNNRIPNWKIALLSSISPRINLLARFPMENGEINQRVKQAYERYHFNQRASKIALMVNRHFTRRAEEESAYQALSGIELEANFQRDIKEPPPWIGIIDEEFTGSSADSITIDSNKKLIIDARSGDNFFSSGSDMVLTFHSIPYVYLATPNKTYYTHTTPWHVTYDLGVKFKLDANTTIEIDGKQLTLAKVAANNVLLNFTQLKLKNDTVNFVLNNVKGVLTPGANTIKLQIFSK